MTVMVHSEHKLGCVICGEPLDPESVGRNIADAVRRVSNREAFRFVNIDWTALGAALVAEWPLQTTRRDDR